MKISAKMRAHVCQFFEQFFGIQILAVTKKRGRRPGINKGERGSAEDSTVEQPDCILVTLPQAHDVLRRLMPDSSIRMLALV